MSSRNKYLVPLILVTSLFFLWAFLHNLNPILIPHLKKACQLTDTQSSFIDSSVYAGYFLMAIPAGLFMHRYGYKKGILAGLFLFGLGLSVIYSRRLIPKLYFLFSCIICCRQWGYFFGNSCQSLCNITWR